MSFQVGGYVRHPHYGVGRIREVGEGNNPDLVIDYQLRKDLRVSARLTENSAQTLSPEGFLAFWFEDSAEALKLLDDDPARAVELALLDFPETRAKTDELKDYFAVTFRGRDWTKWWKKTQQAVKHAEHIDTSKSNEREYSLRKQAVSLAEESFNRFQRTRLRGDLKKAYAETAAIFNAIEKGASLSDAHIEDLKGFYKQVLGDTSLDASVRLDAVSRLEEREWLAAEDARAAKSALVQETRLYRLGTFAQNRVLDFLLANAEDPDMQTALLTGLSASTVSMDRVLAWLTRRGDPDLVLPALRAALGENLPTELPPADYATLAVRLDQSVKLVALLTGATDALSEVVTLSENLAGKIAASQGELESKQLIAPLLRLGSALFDRAAPGQLDLGNRLAAALVGPSLPFPFRLSVIGRLDEAQVSSTCRSQLEAYALTLARSGPESVLPLLLGASREDPTTQVSRLLELARDYGSQDLRKQATDRLARLYAEASNAEKVKMIPELDIWARLNSVPSGDPFFMGQRRGAYFAGLLERMPALPLDQPVQFGAVDRAIALAINDYVLYQTREMQAQLAKLGEKNAAQQQQIEELSARLEETHSRMGELGQGVVQNPQLTRYEERFRLLREFAASVAEFERVYSKPEIKSSEVDALLRRLNNLLAAQGVFPRGTLGSIIEFDTAYCQLVGETPVQATQNDQVQVVERGYTIKDPQGTPRLLKPVLVRPVQPEHS